VATRTTGAGVVGGLEVVHGADAGQQQRGDLGVLDHVGHGFDPFQIGVRAEAVVEARALQAIAVGDFDRVDLGLVQGAGDVLHVLQGILVTDGVAAVAQGHVGDVDFSYRHVALLRPVASTAPCARRWPGGGGHDVEVAGVGRQVMGGAFDFEEDRGLQAGEFARPGMFNGASPGYVELHLLLEAIARHIGLHGGGHLDDAASTNA
jgi:hypothetical protein